MASFVKLVLILFILVIATSTVIAQEEEFTFGVVLVGPANDRGWSQAHVEGAEYVVEQLPNTNFLLFESLNPADAPETSLSDVVAEMVDQGAELIFTTSDAFEEDTPIVAAQYPDVTFINISGDNVPMGEAPPNMGNFTGRLADARQLAGCAAALKTQTGHIGMVGPLINDETRRDQSTAYLGAKYCWENHLGRPAEDLTFTVTWIGFWFHIPGVTLDPTEVTNQLLDSGADVIISGIDTLEPIQVVASRFAEGEQVWSIGTDSRLVCEVSPEPASTLATQYHNWGPSYLETVQSVMDGTWEQSFVWYGPDWDDINNLDTSHIGFIYCEGLDSEDRQLLDQYIAKIAAFQQDPANENYLFSWCAGDEPINLQDGTQLVAPGECLPAFRHPSEGPSMWYLPQLLEGMIGAST